MKFTNLFTLLVASSALAYNVPMKRDEFQDEAQNLGQAYDAANFDQIANDLENGKLPTDTDTLTTGNIPTGNIPTTGNLSTGNQAADNSQMSGLGNINGPECEATINEINSKCQIDVKGSKDSICKVLNGDGCKAALNKDLSSCGDLSMIFGPSFAAYKLGCAVDENGKYCPLAVALENDKEPDYDALAQETCKSKACTDNAINNLPELKKLSGLSTASDIQKLDKFVASLKEEKCTAAHSGASHVKVGSALLFTLALVLSYF